MSIISAGTTTTTALSSTGNTDGTLQFQVNGTTASVTLNTLGAVGVGSTPNFGTAGQALVSAGSTAAPTWANVTTSPAGSNTQIQYNNGGAFGASSGLIYDGTKLAISSSSAAVLESIKSTSSTSQSALFQINNDADVPFNIGVFGSTAGTFGVLGASTPFVSTNASTLNFVNTNASGAVVFGTGSSATERFRFGPAGQLGIGGATYGSSGQVLTSGGSGAAPSWASPAGGGSMIFLSTVTASGASTVSIETTFDSTYDQYVIFAPAFTLSGTPTNSELKMQLKIGGSYPASSGYMYVSNQTNNTTYSGLSSSNNDAIYLSSRLSDSASFPNAVMDLIIYVSKPSTTNRYKTVMWQGSQTFGNNPNTMNGVGWYSASTAALTGVRLLFAGGATFSGSFRLYGIKNS